MGLSPEGNTWSVGLLTDADGMRQCMLHTYSRPAPVPRLTHMEVSGLAPGALHCCCVCSHLHTVVCTSP